MKPQWETPGHFPCRDTNSLTLTGYSCTRHFQRWTFPSCSLNLTLMVHYTISPLQMPLVYWTNTKSQGLVFDLAQRRESEKPMLWWGSPVSRKYTALESTPQTTLNSLSCYLYLILMLPTFNIGTILHKWVQLERIINMRVYSLRIRDAGPHLGSDLTASRAFLFSGSGVEASHSFAAKEPLKREGSKMTEVVLCTI